MTFYLWIYMPRDPEFWPTDPKFYGQFECNLRSGFWAWNGELKGPGVSGSEGENSPFRGDTPKLTSYSDILCPKPHSTHFLVPMDIFGPIYRTEQFLGSGRGCCSTGNRFGVNGWIYTFLDLSVKIRNKHKPWVHRIFVWPFGLRVPSYGSV